MDTLTAVLAAARQTVAELDDLSLAGLPLPQRDEAVRPP